MNNLNSINNNGVPYYFPADIAKEGGQYVRISNFFKTRVGDNGKVLPFKWYDQGRVMNVHGFIPFIQGLIGKFSTDDNDEVIMSPDASYREWQGSTANAHDGGFIDYILEDQMFPQEGIFKGHFGLKDGSGNVLTSVNIIFEVLGNDLRVSETVKYYVGELENLKNQYKIQGDQAVADFNAKIESGIETDRQALDALRKSIQANRDGQESISEQQSALMRQIKDNDIITVAQHKSDINNISTAINDRLSKMKNAPVAVNSLADLTNNYPNGADGTFLATNNQHLYVWVDNRWTDLGTYQATSLDRVTEEDLGAVKSLVLKSNLIRNGGFGYNDPSPAYAAGTAELGTFDFLGERWLTVSTKTPAAYQGVRWDIDNPFATLGSPYPLHLEFNLVTQDKMNLFVNLVGYDANNKRIGGDTGGITIDMISTKPWKFLHNSYKINVPESLISADHFTLEILQAETKSITQIRVTGIQMDVVYDTNTPQLSDNLLENALFTGKSSHPDTMTSKTRLGSTDWIQLSDSNIRSFNGINFTFKNPYKDYQIQYPLHFEATVMSQEEVQYKVILYGLDTNGQRIGGDTGGITIKTFTPQVWIATKINEDVFINSDLVGAESLVIQIVQPDTKALAMLRARGLLVKVLDYQLSKSNLLDNANVAHNGLQHISANTADTILSPFNYLKGTWTKITSKGSQWAGIQYDIAGNSQNFDAPVKLSFDYLTEETMNLQLDIVYYDASGKQLGLQAIKQNWKLVANKPQSYSVTFNLNSSFRDAKRAVLQICSPDIKPIKNLNIKDVSLTNTYPSTSESTWDVDKIEKMYGLPVVKIDGDFTGISHDNAKQITYEFKKAGTYISGYGTIKWQGDSSTMFPKKGYRLKTFKADYQTKDKIRVIPSWSKHSKFNLKAYYTDGTLARDPIAANIGARIWAERTDLPKDLVNEDNFGFVDGFPITLIINNTYEGVYWFNLPRPDFDYTKYAIIGSQYVDATAFEKVPDGGVKLDGSDFESLNPEDKPTAEEKQAVSDLINWVVSANDTTFTADLEKHFNKNSLIDYLVFTNIVGARDAYGKNQVLLSWDGKVWYYQPYDLDCVYNANWNGTVFDTLPKYDPNNPKHPSFGDNSRLFRLLARIYYDDVCKRYTQVRQWCTPEYVLNLFKTTVNEIGSSNYQREWDKWNDPAKDTEDFKQLKSAVYDHFRLADQTWLKDPNAKNLQS